MPYALLLLLASFVPFQTFAADLSGKARVIDGDTIELSGERVRLHGIDAPERRQTCVDGNGNSYPCGERATEALREIIGTDSVRCDGDKQDRYHRLIGTCYVGNINVNAEMVLRGWAFAYVRYSKDYIGQESRAMDNHAGMWGGEFIMPWDWRRKR